MADGFMTLHRDWRCTYLNKAAAAFLKTTPAEILGRVIWDAFPHLRNSRFHKEFLRAAQEKAFVKVEDYYEPLGRWYECRCHPTHDGLTVFLNDATGHKKIEEAMLESRQVLEMAIAGSNAGIWRIDLNPEKPGYLSDYVYLSPQLKALIGFESNEFPNSRSAWQDRIVSEDRVRLDEAARAHGEGRTETYQVDFRIRHKDGSLRWLASRGRLFRDEFNRPIRWAGVDTDITERKLAGEALQENAERLRQALEAGQVFTFEWRPATDEVLRSPNSASILGWTGDATHDTGQGFFDRIRPEDREAFVRLVSTLSPEQPAYEATYRYVRRDDGREVVLEESGRAVFDESGTIVCLRGLTRDITERKRVEDALRLRTEEIERLMDVLPVGVAVAEDPWCRRIRINRTNAEMLGIPADCNASLSAPQEQALGYRVLRAGRECPAEGLPMQVAACEGRPVLNEEYDVARPDGNVTSVLMSAVPLRDDRGEPRGAVGAIVDITERKRAEQAIRQLKEQAERAAEQARWLARIPEESPNPVLRISNEHVMLYSNPAGEKLCEYWGCWLGHKVPPVVQDIIADALGAGAVRNHEILCGGRTFWLAVAPCPTEDYVNVFARDITERKRIAESLHQANECLQLQAEELENSNEELQAQREELQSQAEELQNSNEELRAQQEELQIQAEGLRESEQALRRAHEQAAWLARFPQENPNPVLRVSFAGEVLYCNPAAATLPGWTCKVGEPLPQAMLRHLIDGATAGGHAIEQDVELDGTPYAVAVSSVAAERYANVYGRDITEHKRAEEALRISELKYRRLYESMRDAFVIVGMDGRVQDSNAAYREMVGYTQEELSRLTYEDLTPQKWHDVEARIVEEQILPEDSSEVYEKEYRRKDGTVFPVELRTYLIRDDAGRPHQMWAIVRDITERKQAEEKAKKEHRETAFANRVLRAFVECEGDELFDRALAVVQEEMSSRHGVFGYIAEPGHLICPSLSKMLDECEIEGKCIHYPPEKWKGLWARALRKKQSIYTNEAPPVPPGHPIIHNNLAAPILFHGQVIGLLNVANKEGGYSDEDQRTLDAIAARIAPVLYAWIQRKLREDERRQAEQAIHEANEQLQAQNEELQAQGEELQTQAEELHAQTEELATANEALRTSERKYRELIETANSVIIRWDSRGVIRFINDYGLRFLGYSAKELLGRDVMTIVSKVEESTDRDLDALVKDIVVHPEQYTYVPSENIRKDRTTAWVAWTNKAILDEQGNVREILAIGNDITELKQAEAAVNRSRKTLSELVERSPFGTYVVDSRFRVAMMNASSQEGAFRGVRPVIGRDFAQAMRILWPEDVAANIIGHFRHTLDTGEPYYSPRFINPRHDVETVESYEWELHRMTLPDGQFGVICYYFDSTKLREAEEALRESEERLRRVARAGRIGLFEWNATRDSAYWSPEHYELFGFEPDSSIKYERWLACVHPDDRERVTHNTASLMADGGTEASADPHRDEYRIVRGDGTVLWLETTVSVDRAGGDLILRGAVRDITERKCVEEALRESEERFRRAVENATGAIVIAGFDGAIHYANRAFLTLLGYDEQDVEADSLRWDTITPPEFAVADEAAIEELRQRGIAAPREKEYFTRDGRRVPVLVSGSVMGIGPDGRPQVVAFITDLTPIKKAEQTVRDSEQRLRMALEGGRMGLWEWDIEAGHDFWDRRVYELLGLDRQGPANLERFLQHVDPLDVERLNERTKKSLADGGDFEAEFRLIRRSGKTVWVASRGRTIRDASGKIVRMLGVLFDITARKQMEEQLRRLNDQLEEEVQAQTEELRDTVDRLQDEVVRRVVAEGKLRKSSQVLEGFFQHTITPLAFMDRQFNFVQVNEAYARSNGKSPEFFKGKNHFDLYPHEENQAIFEQVVQTGRPHRAFAKPFQHPDDPLRVTYWDWQLTPLRNDRGEVQYLVLNLQDVTRQQATLDELEHRAFQLQKLTLELSQAEDRERRRMAEVLHDGLQQQLAAAKFHLGLLSSRARNDVAMQEIAGQLDQMLRDAIEQSRSLSHELSPAVLYQSDLGETFEWLARQVKTKHGLTVHTEVHGHVDSSSESLKAFLFRTGQEILFNAVKHAKVNETRLRLQRRHERLWLTIADRGQGFDPNALGRAAGFGLLSIRERARLLGGRMKIRSVPGKGSVFLVAVPDARVAEDRGLRTDDRGQKTGNRADRRPPSSVLRPQVLRVLLVDDHKVMREGLAALIAEEKDMKIVGQAGDGREAVKLARELEPDVVIMDVAMPVMPGDEATRRIKAELPQIRVVALSMFAEPGVREKMLGAGAEIYLPKTGPSEELLAAIRGQE